MATTSFTSLVQLVGADEGVPDLKYAEYPGTATLESEEVIKENIEKTTIDQIIQALTKSPVASASDSTQTTAAGRIVMKGSHQEIAESLIRDGLFTDGLAVTPPTSYLVEELLDYTDCSADEEIAETAIQEDVDVIGLNIGGRYNTVRDLIDILKEKKIMDRLLIVGGTIPP